MHQKWAIEFQCKMKHKFNPLADADNEKLLAELCLWIEKNIDSNIGWKELSSISKLTHTELQFLFDKYKQTTPMTYIHKQKEQIKKVQPVYTITENFLAKPRE